ncbi:MAG: flagellar biosynthesis protein FlhB [bacterium]|jgi:flagellar biosynthetic protein FlhB
MNNYFINGRKLDLQLFAEKSEAPTARRRQEARKRGQVFRSNEVSTAVSLLVLFLSLRYLGSYMSRETMQLMRQILSGLSASEMTREDFWALVITVIYSFLRIILPVLCLSVAAGVTTNLFQIGFLFTVEPLSVRFERLNPVSGWQRLVSKRAWVELAKSLCKLFLVGLTVFVSINREIHQIVLLADMEINQASAQIAALAYNICLKAAASLLILAAGDYFYQRWENEQQLRMTKQEVKEELKQTEGNPQIKSRIRQIQRSIAMRRMMAEVPKADVIITNPTHFAVALRYDPARMSAPKVVAKGADYMAERIKKTAREHKVTIVEERELARSLYRSAEVGDIIPEMLYQAVAEVLAFVYRLQGRA